MKPITLIISTFIGLVSFAQTSKVTRSIFALDISDSTKRLFYSQLDSFKKYQAGIIPMDERNKYLMDSSLISFTKGGLFYGIKQSFGRTGGIGDGYHEGDEPHKITASKGSNETSIPSIYDFEDSTCWLSSPDFNDDKINLYFKKGFPPLTKLIFFTGNQSSISNWDNYSRPKKLFVYINSKFWTELNFEDCICKQEFKFDPISSERKDIVITLVIKEVYKGQDNRVAISEINFDGIIH